MKSHYSVYVYVYVNVYIYIYSVTICIKQMNDGWWDPGFSSLEWEVTINQRGKARMTCVVLDYS